jgi:glycosyltransferase involved in cell wall biosynthesis
MPASALNERGFFAVVGETIGRKQSGEVIVRSSDGVDYDGLDIVVFQRWMSPQAAEVFNMAKSTGQVIINDLDDWYEGLSPSNQAFRASHPRFGLTNEFGAPLNRSDARRIGDARLFRENRNFYKESLKASSALTVSTPFLRNNLRVPCPIYVIPNCIDLDRFFVKQQSNVPTIGWVGSTMYRSGDLEILKGIIGPFCKKHDLTFHHSGHVDGYPAAASLLGIDPNRVTTSPMESIYNYPSLLTKFDVGVIPLVDTNFNTSKSAIKGMEMAAAGVPFVASRSESYADLSSEGIGLTSRRHHQWIKLLESLIDKNRRVQLAEEGRSLLKSRDIAQNWSNWLQVYLSCLS